MPGRRFIAVLGILLAAPACGSSDAAGAADCAGSAQAFWRDFRSAVTAGDAAKVNAFAARGFELRSEMDGDPVTRISGANAGRVLQEKMGEDTGLREEAYPQRALIADTPQPAPVECVGPRGEFRVGNFVFRFNSGAWALAAIYSNE